MWVGTPGDLQEQKEEMVPEGRSRQQQHPPFWGVWVRILNETELTENCYLNPLQSMRFPKEKYVEFLGISTQYQ